MELFEALKLVRDGKAITRRVWKNPTFHIKLIPDPNISPFQTIHIFIPEKNTYDRWIMCSEDLDADDWEETAPMVKPIIPTPGLPMSKGGIILPNRPALVAARNSSPVPKKKM